MKGTEGNIELIEGKNLLGFMPLEREEYPVGEWDNAIALYFGTANNPETYVLRTENQDYSCYDKWLLEKVEYIERTDRYKAIGEVILKVENKTEEVKDWTLEEDQYWLFIKTKTKELRFGHHWYDCHYPKSIWEYI